MTPQQIQQALESVQKILEIVAADEGWKAIWDEENADLDTSLNDAIHYLAEVIEAL